MSPPTLSKTENISTGIFSGTPVVIDPKRALPDACSPEQKEYTWEQRLSGLSDALWVETRQRAELHLPPRASPTADSMLRLLYMGPEGDTSKLPLYLRNQNRPESTGQKPQKNPSHGAKAPPAGENFNRPEKEIHNPSVPWENPAGGPETQLLLSFIYTDENSGQILLDFSPRPETGRKQKKSPLKFQKTEVSTLTVTIGEKHTGARLLKTVRRPAAGPHYEWLLQTLVEIEQSPHDSAVAVRSAENFDWKIRISQTDELRCLEIIKESRVSEKERALAAELLYKGYKDYINDHALRAYHKTRITNQHVFEEILGACVTEFMNSLAKWDKQYKKRLSNLVSLQLKYTCRHTARKEIHALKSPVAVPLSQQNKICKFKQMYDNGGDINRELENPKYQTATKSHIKECLKKMETPLPSNSSQEFVVEAASFTRHYDNREHRELERRDLIELVDKCISRLKTEDPRERIILKTLFHSAAIKAKIELAAKFQITRERVAQLCKSAMLKLREMLAEYDITELPAECFA
ncbi:hypothetical protein OH491_24225 [Termitidicoccus mucosus]